MQDNAHGIAIVGMQAFEEVNGALGVGTAFHVEAHEVVILPGFLQNLGGHGDAEVFIEVHAHLGELEGHVGVQAFGLNRVEDAFVFSACCACFGFRVDIFAQEVE